MAGQHLPADHSRGDANTIGGYAAVHGRPAAFEGTDGLSYSVEIVASPTGHLETDFLAEADTEADARAIVGALSLGQVRAALHALIEERAGGTPSRRWWDAMKDEGTGNDAGGMS